MKRDRSKLKLILAAVGAVAAIVACVIVWVNNFTLAFGNLDNKIAPHEQGTSTSAVAPPSTSGEVLALDRSRSSWLEAAELESLEAAGFAPFDAFWALNGTVAVEQFEDEDGRRVTYDDGELRHGTLTNGHDTAVTCRHPEDDLEAIVASLDPALQAAEVTGQTDYVQGRVSCEVIRTE